MRVPVVKSLKKKHYDVLDDFFISDHRVEVDYPDITENILDHVLGIPLDSFYAKRSDYIIEESI